MVSKPSPSVKSGGKKTVASNEETKANKGKKQAEKNLAKKNLAKKIDSKEKKTAGNLTEETSSKPAIAQKATESKQK